jgi:very-short-patch-repair endonuclease
MFRYDLYDSTSLPSKPDGFGVEPVRKKTRVKLNAIDVVAKLENYSKLEISNQLTVMKGIKSTLATCLELIEKRSSRFQFDFDVTNSIFHLLPKLPIEAQTLQKLTEVLLERISVVMVGYTVSAPQAAALLSAFAKLSLDINTHKELIKTLLQSFETISKRIPHTKDSLLSEMWLFLAYARAQKYQNTKVLALFESVDAELATRGQTVTTSKFQTKVDETLYSLLSAASQQDSHGEHPAGSYSMDIAFPSCKLNIEIDGPHHYREESLTRASKFRDYILQSLGWTVIRIPHFEWNEKTNKQSKQDYLLIRLANHTNILNEAALSRLKYLNKAKVSKPDLLYINAASAIPLATLEEMLDAEQETKKQSKEPATKRFLSSSRYLTEVFAEKLAHKRYATTKAATEWDKVIKGENTFFRLRKIKKPHRFRTRRHDSGFKRKIQRK